MNDTASISSFSASGLDQANYDVTVQTAGVRAAYSTTNDTTLVNASAVAVFDATSSTGVSASSTFDQETTVSIQNAGTTLASVTVAAGSTWLMLWLP